MHEAFGKMRLWFTQDEVFRSRVACWYTQLNLNRYRINYVLKGHRTEGFSLLPGFVPSGDYVEFFHATPEYPQISGKLLAIHAAIAEVLHMTGAGEAIDIMLREWGSIQVLSEDGADAQLLLNKLQMIATC